MQATSIDELRERYRKQRVRENAAAQARNHDRRVIKALGVKISIAAMRWLGHAAAAADGHATRRGNEVGPLIRDGRAGDDGRECVNNAGTPHEVRWHVARPTITDAGRDLVRQARALGW